jgi:hypothetical protein
MEKSDQIQLFRTTAWMQEVEQRMEQLPSRHTILGQPPRMTDLFFSVSPFLRVRQFFRVELWVTVWVGAMHA